MAQNKEKIVQAFIQAVKDIANKVIEADTLAQSYKAKYIALNPDLTDTNLTSQQVSAVNTWIEALNDLRNDAVVTTVETKDIPTHGVKALG